MSDVEPLSLPEDAPIAADRQQAIRDALRRSALLAECRDDVFDELAASSRRRALPRDSLLILEGDRPVSMFVLVDGLLRVFTTAVDGTEPSLTVLLPGDHVGELGVLLDTPRSASVGSLRPSTVVEVSGRALLEAYDRDPAISKALVAQLAARLRSASTRLTDVTILDLGARMARYLASEMTTVGGGGQAAPFVELMFTQSELEQLLGGARQSINQVLSTFERDGLIAVRGRRIDVLDPANLRRRSMAW